MNDGLGQKCKAGTGSLWTTSSRHTFLELDYDCRLCTGLSCNAAQQPRMYYMADHTQIELIC